MIKALRFRAELNEAFAIPNKSAVRANAHPVSYERREECEESSVANDDTKRCKGTGGA